MNNLSWPTSILVGILLGLAAVAANRPADDQPSAGRPNSAASAAPDVADAHDSGGSAGHRTDGSGDHSGNGSVEADPRPAGGPAGEQGLPGTGAQPVTETGDRYTLTLTFDDGPNPTYTPQVLALLHKHDATAVFCVVGQSVHDYPQLVQRTVAAGHTLCNHTYAHDGQFSKRTKQDMVRDISRTKEEIDSAVGGRATVPYFRQPNTYVQPSVMPVLESLDLRPLDWTIDPRDWSRPGADAIVQSVLGQLRPGAVVLLHDGGGDRSQTVAALEQILDGIDAAGYRYVMPGEK